MIRHLAEDLHVDPERIHGSGPGGRVHRDDVEAAAHQPMRPRVTPRARRLLSERGIDPTTVADQGYVSGDHVLAIESAPLPEQPPSKPPSNRHNVRPGPRRCVATSPT